MADKILAFRIDIEGTSKEADAISRIDIELAKLNEERREAINLAKKGGEEEKKQAQRLAQISSKTKDLQTKKAQLNQTEKASSREFKSTSGSMEQLRARTTKLRAEINQLDLTDKKNLATLRQKKAEITANTKRIRDFDRSISGSSTLVGEYSRGIVSSFRSISVAILGVMAAIRLLSGAINTVTQDFATFETGQLAVQGLLDQNNDLMANQTIDLMKSYGLATEDTNKALFDAVSAGVEAGKSYQFMAQAAELAIGGNTTLSTSVDGLTTIINAYGLATDDANKVASAFFSSQKFGKTTVEELSKSVGRAAPIAKQLGVTYQELLTQYALYTKRGIATEETGTAIRAMMIALQKPAAEQIAAFERLGIEYGATNVKAAGFINVMTKIQNAVAAGDAELVELIPNIRALTAAGSLDAAALEEYHEILKVVNEDYGEGSSLARAFALQQDSMRNYIDRLKASFRAGRIALGNFLSPLIKGFVNAVAPIKQTSQTLREQQFELNALARAAMNENNTRESRARLIERINKQYPELLKGLDAEKVTNEEIKTALENVNAEYEKRIKLELAKEVYEIQKKALAELIVEEGNLLIQLEEANRIREEGIGWERTWASTAQQNAAIIQQQTIPNALERNRAAQELYNQQIQKSIELINSMQIVAAGGEPPPDVEGGGGTKTTGEINTQAIETRQKQLAYEALLFEQSLENETLALVESEEERIKLEEMRIEREKLMHEDYELWKEQKREEEIAAEQAKTDRILDITNSLSSATMGVIGNISQAQQNAKEKELEAAGDNAAKKEEIERKYAKKQQNLELAQAVISAARVIVNAALTQPFIPAGLIAVGTATAMMASQIYAIKSQEFATGGKIQPGAELPGSRPGTDNTLILAKPGETILNQRQQAMLGGPEVFRRIGVPGFATGGLIGSGMAPIQDAGTGGTESITRGISTILKELRVVLNLNELHDAEDELSVTTKPNEL